MAKTFVYKTKGTCSREITVVMEGDTIVEVSFLGGCNGNLKGISSLVKGKKAADVIDSLSGINCGGKGTSCPDQLAKALTAALEEA